MSTVVVFGASGYVGRHLLDELRRRGHDLVVVARPDAAAGRYEDLGARVVADAGLPAAATGETVLVNLAYPRAVPGLDVRQANDRLIARVTRAVEATGARRLIHVSTQAVFGYQWRTPPRPLRAPLRLGDSYVETKRVAENALRRHRRRHGHELAIVRLGNVLGAGAEPWASVTAQRILEGRPVAGGDGRGMLNGTYVRNIADYIATLAAHPGPTDSMAGTEFHHLAEFAERRWHELVGPMAETIGVRPTYRPDVPVMPGVGAKTLAGSAVRRAAPLLKRAPRLLGAIQRVRPKIRVAARGVPTEDAAHFAITGGAIALPSALLPGWVPPHSWETMIDELRGWLPAHGFVLEPR